MRWVPLTTPAAPNERFSAASKAAEASFKGLDAGGPLAPRHGIGRTCERHMQSLRDDPDKGDTAADNMAGYVRRFVVNDKMAAIPVDKLKRGDVADWRKRMERKPVAQPKRGKHCRNRAAAASTAQAGAGIHQSGHGGSRAALRQAQAEGYYELATDQAWAQPLKPIKGGSTVERERYLTREQRQSLIEHAREDAQPFLRALAELPLRVGAVAALRVGDYDRRNKLLTIRKDKAGAGRTIPLPPSAVDMLKQAASGKLRTAPLCFPAGMVRRGQPPHGKTLCAMPSNSLDLPRDTVAYTLRHCAIADLVVGGCDLHTVAKISGTSLQMIARRFGNLRQDVAREALAALAV